jgi:hypothetical protein
MRIRKAISVGCLLTVWASVISAQPPGETYDVVVVSGSSGGFGAALAAGRMGARVALIEDTPVLGGMLANGISNIDTYSYESLSGIFEEFRAGVREYYRPLFATDPIFEVRGAMPQPKDYRAIQSNHPQNGGRWEPHAADRIFKDMLAAVPAIRVFYDTWATGVTLQGRHLTGVVTENKRGEKRTFYGKVIIDATHEADVAAWAGVPYRVGREPRSPLEPHAGEVYFFNGTGEILEGSTGQQDRAVVSYGLRLCIKNYTDKDGRSHILSSAPPGYNKEEYVHSAYTGRPSMPGAKSEMNANPVGNEVQEVNWAWPEATREERLKLYELYKRHALGYLYFLQHERGLTHLGLPKDEFTDNENVPYRVFVREARRIEGEVTMTEADINPFITGTGMIPALRRDSVAIGHYPIDSKPVRSKTDVSTPDKGAGDFFLSNAMTAFQVPYGAIVPKHVEGLLVPVAISATHVAFSAIRMDPTWMMMGQAAGVAAVLSIREQVEPRRLPVEKLQRELLRQKCRLMFYWDMPLDHPAFAAVQWLSVNKGATGTPERLFEPDKPLTRADLAAIVVKSLGLWPSISNVHFTDVSWEHPAFREIETMFDNRLLEPLGVKPGWRAVGGYDPKQHAGFTQGQHFGEFSPYKPVSWGELIGVLQRALSQPLLSPGAGIVKTAASTHQADLNGWLQHMVTGSEFGKSLIGKTVQPDSIVTRGEASILLAAVTTQ